MSRTLRLAVGQSPADLETTKARLNWLSDAMPEVADRKSDLLLLPELFATGYNIGREIAVRAEPTDGAITQEISSLAKTYGVAIHYGFPEVDGDVIYNAAQCIGPDGERLGGHRKLAIPPGFEQDHFAPGRGCRLFSYRGVWIATLICYDAEFPETVRHVASMGAELVLVPTALSEQWEWVSQRMIPTRAYENGVYLAYANSAGTEHGMKFLGQSFIATPDGRELARAQTCPEIIFGELQLEKVTKAQARLPYLKDRKALSTGIFGQHWIMALSGGTTGSFAPRSALTSVECSCAFQRKMAFRPIWPIQQRNRTAGFNSLRCFSLPNDIAFQSIG